MYDLILPENLIFFLNSKVKLLNVILMRCAINVKT